MKRFYGAGPLHLLLMGFVFVLVGYAVYVAGLRTFWNKDVWWQSISVWFVGALLIHDLVLYPLYSLADRGIRVGVPASLVNYIRVPLLGTALTFVLFFPGIIRQGSETFTTATGLTQEPYLVRWLILSAGLFAISAVVYAVRFLSTPRSVS